MFTWFFRLIGPVKVVTQHTHTHLLTFYDQLKALTPRDAGYGSHAHVDSRVRKAQLVGLRLRHRLSVLKTRVTMSSVSEQRSDFLYRCGKTSLPPREEDGVI